MTVAALLRRGIAARMSPPVIRPYVIQARARLANGMPKARVATNCKKPQIKNVVQTRAFMTPCKVSPW
jgi:hypothetical protein